MADQRVKDFLTTFIQASKADLTGLFMWVDKQGWTDAQKWEAVSMIFDAVVEDGNNDYTFMTPKAFWNSIMTTTRRGVGNYATDAQIEGKTTEGLIRSNQQATMQNQWKKDLFQSNGSPAFYISDDFANGNTAWWTVAFNEPAMVSGNYYSIAPNLPRNIYALYYRISARVYGETAHLYEDFAFTYSAFTQVHLVPGANSSLYTVLTGNGTDFQLRHTYGSNQYVFASVTVNAICQ